MAHALHPLRLIGGIAVALALLSGATAMYLKVPAMPPTHLSDTQMGSDEAAAGARDPATGPEPLLADILNLIERGDSAQALTRLDALLAAYPTFRLAYLIKGDLLLARTQALNQFGQGATRAPDKVSDLRDEAVVRLAAYRNKPPANAVPRYLSQMSPKQNYALVMDASKARLYLFRNDHGTPRYVKDFYVTQGRFGSDKSREGDMKTPIGVYHITSELARDSLADLYGTGAFPLNYPNEQDKRQGRGGSGIWLHGTMSNTFSRAPKASNGCVVLPNSDLDAIAEKLQIGLTPVIISNSIEWVSLDNWQRERAALLKVIDDWRQDWESRDTDRYAQHYSRKFSANHQDYDAWIDQKRRVNAGKEWIKVKADNISLFRAPGQDDYVVTTFDQDYQSNTLKNTMRKRQYWVQEDGRWKIIYEGSA